LGQIYNVLIILAIALLMAVITVVIAYFVDFIPSTIDNSPLIAASLSAWERQEMG